MKIAKVTVGLLAAIVLLAKADSAAVQTGREESFDLDFLQEDLEHEHEHELKARDLTSYRNRGGYNRRGGNRGNKNQGGQDGCRRYNGKLFCPSSDEDSGSVLSRSQSESIRSEYSESVLSKSQSEATRSEDTESVLSMSQSESTRSEDSESVLSRSQSESSRSGKKGSGYTGKKGGGVFYTGKKGGGYTGKKGGGDRLSRSRSELSTGSQRGPHCGYYNGHYRCNKERRGRGNNGYY